MITIHRFKDFQGPFTSNSKSFKDLFHFQGLSRSWKPEHLFSRTFKALWPPCSRTNTKLFLSLTPAKEADLRRHGRTLYDDLQLTDVNRQDARSVAGDHSRVDKPHRPIFQQEPEDPSLSKAHFSRVTSSLACPQN